MSKFWIAILSIFAFIGTAHAQESIRYRLQAGVGVSGYEYANSIGNTLGLHIGGYTDIQFTERPILLSTGLALVKRGGDGDGTPGNIKINAYYAEIPIHVRWESSLFGWDSIDYFVSAGPYVGVGLFGKTKWNAYDYTISSTVPGVPDENKHVKGDSVSSFSKSGLRRFDVGMGANFGLIFNERYEVSATFNIGFIDALRVGRGNILHFSVNFGYLF